MLASLVFLTNKSRKIQKIDENSSNRSSKNTYFLRDLMNFNEIFGKNVTYDDIKSN